MSLTSVCFKVLKRVVASQLVEFLGLNDLLSVNKFDLRKDRSVKEQYW